MRLAIAQMSEQTPTPNPANDNERLLTIDEAAAELRVCKRTLNRLIDHGELPYIVTGNGRQRLRKTIHPSDLNHFIAARRRFDCQSTSQPRALTTHSISKSGAFGSPALRSALASETLRHSRSS